MSVRRLAWPRRCEIAGDFGEIEVRFLAPVLALVVPGGPLEWW